MSVVMFSPPAACLYINKEKKKDQKKKKKKKKKRSSRSSLIELGREGEIGGSKVDVEGGEGQGKAVVCGNNWDANSCRRGDGLNHLELPGPDPARVELISEGREVFVLE